MKERAPYTWDEVIKSFRSRLGEKLLSLLQEEWYSIRELTNLLKKDKEKKGQRNPHIARLINMWKEIGILNEKYILKFFKRTINGKEDRYPNKRPRVSLNLAKFFSLYFRFFLRYSIPVCMYKDKEIISNYENIIAVKSWAGHLLTGLEEKEGWKIFFPVKGEFIIEKWFEVLFDDEDAKKYVLQELERKNIRKVFSPVKFLEDTNITLSELERTVLKFYKQIYIVYDYLNESDLLPNWVRKIEEKYVEESLKVTTDEEIRKLWERYYMELFREYLKRKWRTTKKVMEKNELKKKEVWKEKKEELEEECRNFDLPWIKLFTWIRLLPLGNELYDMYGGDVEDILGLESFSLIAFTNL